MSPRKRKEATVEEPAASEGTDFNYGANEQNGAPDQAQQPAAEVTAAQVNGNGHEVEGQPKILDRASIVSDVAAKMKFHFNYDARPQLAAVTFDDGKPSEQVRQALKEGGYRWNNDEKAWEIPIEFNTREQDRLHARRVFESVAEIRREEFGVGQGIAS